MYVYVYVGNCGTLQPGILFYTPFTYTYSYTYTYTYTSFPSLIRSNDHLRLSPRNPHAPASSCDAGPSFPSTALINSRGS